MNKATLYKLMMDKMAFGKENQKITDATLLAEAIGNEIFNIGSASKRKGLRY